MPNKPILVIGGGPSGLEAARGIADLGYNAILVDKSDFLGGNPISASYAALTPDMRNAEEAMGEMIAAITDNPSVDIRMNTTVVSSEGKAPNLKVTLKNGVGDEKIEVGSVIVSTGFQHFDPGNETQIYGYYEFEDVITIVDVEKMLKAGNFVRPSTGEKPKQVCFIQCVGSRDRQIGNQWCSKVCCGIASKQAIEIREIVPDARIFIFYIDMRMYGFWEDEIYWKAQEEMNVNYIRGIVTEITKRGDTLVVKGEDTTMGRPMEIPMDVVILSVGMEPSEGTTEMANIFNIPLESHGFIETIGGALNTVETSVPGVFVAGAAAGPADLEDSISTGGAAVMKACAFVRKSELQQP
ncbi:MAG: CoB--CoM heterodisulfide reductase iron-sulfur subunit A family protein [Candidatus Marinimicrobia bacterium]|nr:CoB--CoM heterodisulfide reductase iron-sulfur subunit A family protein [Candidatus Neomarinimicrobiota bacterium]